MRYSARSAYAALYASYNDIDIYVEDSTLVGLYQRIFEKEIGSKYSIAALIPFGKKADLLSEARRLSKDKSRRRFFLVDGDFDWLHKPRRAIVGLYELQQYSIENFVAEDAALLQFAGQVRPDLRSDEVIKKLKIDEINEDLELLQPLAMLYAVARKLGSGLETVNFSIDRLKIDGKSCRIDREKVRVRALTFYRALCRENGYRDTRLAKKNLESQMIGGANMSRRIVPGKHYIVPLIIKHFQVKLGFSGRIDHFKCSLIEASGLSLDPKFRLRIKRL